jgi:hypothetical protein
MVESKEERATKADATADATTEQRATRRHRGDSKPCGQSPMDFETIS